MTTRSTEKRSRRSNTLRTGFTTGTCAAAAAKAAAMVLLGQAPPAKVEVGLPDGGRVELPVTGTRLDGDAAWAAVRKDAGDDPDVTDGVLVEAVVSWIGRDEVILAAGKGVGIVTKPGLAVPQGEPAINPVPRRMIRQSVREVTDRGLKVTISVPAGEDLAGKTFNPRLGIEGGISILGTSGIVRPFSSSALRDSLKCSLSVARACRVKNPVFVPGRIGERAARRHFSVSDEQVVEVSNEWGFMLDEALEYDFDSILVLGHPGKLAKLADNQWDTHSKRSMSAVPTVRRLAAELLEKEIRETNTVEGIFTRLPQEESELLGNEVARRVREAVLKRVEERFTIAAVLVNLKGDILGRCGDLSPWQTHGTGNAQ
ncbi:MAG: cobalt-precorrin-5B (C(1))-methyltransferase CbiD [Deltaproteobacteria bacterium]